MRCRTIIDKNTPSDKMAVILLLKDKIIIYSNNLAV